MTDVILQKLNNIERMLSEQNLLKKDILNFNEACQYLDISQSHLYKLTSKKEVPHSCPNGKRLYFNRAELDAWLQRNHQVTTEEIDRQASDYIIRKKRQ
ncbi:MAG: helix-turn-helix domain-containing protein [Chitinophagales bacterium]|nr:helix-turn-helix domain-containing protein [Chitinophagales bacterium]